VAACLATGLANLSEAEVHGTPNGTPSLWDRLASDTEALTALALHGMCSPESAMRIGGEEFEGFVGPPPMRYQEAIVNGMPDAEKFWQTPRMACLMLLRDASNASNAHAAWHVIVGVLPPAGEFAWAELVEWLLEGASECWTGEWGAAGGGLGGSLVSAVVQKVCQPWSGGFWALHLPPQ
jgi:hypothetical protein